MPAIATRLDRETRRQLDVAARQARAAKPKQAPKPTEREKEIARAQRDLAAFGERGWTFRPGLLNPEVRVAIQNHGGSKIYADDEVGLAATLRWRTETDERARLARRARSTTTETLRRNNV
jgi:hypothetical protein